MRVKLFNRRVVIWVLFFAILLGFFRVNSASAETGISMSQSILPVRFVYLDKKSDIENIWSNISATDSLYVVKFFDNKTKQEIVPGKEIFDKYEKSVSQDKKFTLNKQSDGANKKEIEYLSVDFVRKNNVIEEVQTLS